MKHRKQHQKGQKRKAEDPHPDRVERRLLACAALAGTLGTLVSTLLALARG